MSSNMFMTSRIDGYGFCKLGYGFCKLFTKQQRVVTVLTLEAELNNKSEGIITNEHKSTNFYKNLLLTSFGK